MPQQPLTTKEAAERITAEFGVYVTEDDVRALYRNGVLPEPPRHGGRRIIFGEDLGQLVGALRGRGVLPVVEAAMH